MRRSFAAALVPIGALLLVGVYMVFLVLWFPAMIDFAYGLAITISAWVRNPFVSMVVLMVTAALTLVLPLALPVVMVLAFWSSVSAVRKKARARKLLKQLPYREALTILSQDSFQKAVEHLQGQGIDREQAKTNLRLLRDFAADGPKEKERRRRVAKDGGLFEVGRGIGDAFALDQGHDEAENLGPYREPAAEDTRDSKTWELKMLQKRASALEQRGDWPQAITCLEAFIAKAESARAIEEARRRIEAMRSRIASGPANPAQPKRPT